MALVAGVATLTSIGSNSAKLSATAPTGATGAVTYQWYRSTSSGFTPGGGNIIAGATALTLDDAGLIPNVPYYWKLVATDQAPSSVTYTQVAGVTAAPSLSPNSFQQEMTLGVVDLRFATNTVSVQVDSTQATALYPGSPVKVVDSAGGIPKVVGCAADSDNCAGFLNFNMKNRTYVALDVAEMSMSGNCIWLYATEAIARFAQVELDLTNHGVAAATPSSGNNIVGYAYDKATAYGQLIRVMLITPSFQVA